MQEHGIAPIDVPPSDVRVFCLGTRHYKQVKGATQWRYLDGQAIAMKGKDKFVIERAPEWDGGSRGRVKTKGKRGPGFR